MVPAPDVILQYYSSITGSRWYRAQLRGAQFGTPNRAPAPRGPDYKSLIRTKATSPIEGFQQRFRFSFSFSFRLGIVL